MGIQASYWLTGGIVAVLGAVVAKVILGFLGGVALAVGAFLWKVAVAAFLVMLAVLGLWLVLRMVRGRRPGRGEARV